MGVNTLRLKRFPALVVLLAVLLVAVGVGARAYTETLPSCGSLGGLTSEVSEDHPYAETSRWCRDSLGMPVQEKLSGSITVETPSAADTIDVP